MNLKDENSSEEKVEIKLNRKMRSWNKYKNYIIIGGVILVIVILMIFILRGCSTDKGTQEKETSSSQVEHTTTPSETQQGSTQQSTTQQSTTQATTQATQTGSTTQITGTASDQTYVGKDHFAGVTFVGDSIISGFSYYGYIDDANVITDGGMTSDKASDYIDQIAATNPSKVVLMVGLNDLNYGTRGADKIADYISSFVSDVKNRIPSAKVYVLSVLPVTSSFESGGNVNITQAGIDGLNGVLYAQAAEKGYNYIDVATAFKDGAGYMDSSYTGNGNNIYNEYYPFLLNGIAGALN